MCLENYGFKISLPSDSHSICRFQKGTGRISFFIPGKSWNKQRFLENSNPSKHVLFKKSMVSGHSLEGSHSSSANYWLCRLEPNTAPHWASTSAPISCGPGICAVVSVLVGTEGACLCCALSLGPRVWYVGNLSPDLYIVKGIWRQGA